MTAGAPTARRSGRVFDEVADEYDRRRPTYPEELLTGACELAAIGSGDEVLEVGCGSGQLTRSLLERGLRVVAVEPGGRLRSLAERNLDGHDQVRFVPAAFEDAELPRGHFRAVFSASAFHWIDPRVGWRKAAEVLVPGGTLTLIQYFGLCDERSEGDQRALLAAVARVAPEIAAEWPSYRDLSNTVSGMQRRRENVSEAWGWLGGYDLTHADAGELFGDVRMAVVPVLLEHRAEELNALLRTMSFHARMTPPQRRALDRETVALSERLGRPIRSTTLAVAVTAQRSDLSGRARAGGAGPHLSGRTAARV